MPGKAMIRLTPRRWDFVEDPALQTILRQDYEELRRLVRAGADKSAVVLSGTLVEALLAGLLSNEKEAARQAWKERNGGRTPAPFEEWTLYPLIQAAVKLEKLDGASEILAGALKDFRNLIHPLAQTRKSIVLTKGTVTTAVALLVGVLDYVESARTRETVQRLEAWVVARGLVPSFTPAQAYMPKLYIDGEAHTLFALRRNRVQIRFGRLKRSNSQFKYRAVREALRQRLNKVGFNLKPSAINAFPSVPLERLTVPGACEAFMETLDWSMAIIQSPQNSLTA